MGGLFPSVPHPQSGDSESFFLCFVVVNKSTGVLPTQPWGTRPARSLPRNRCPSQGAFTPADQSAECTHQPACGKPQRRGQDEDHDHLYHRRPRPGCGRQDDHRQGTGAGKGREPRWGLVPGTPAHAPVPVIAASSWVEGGG